MKRITYLTVMLVFIAFSLSQAEGYKGKFGFFVEAGKSSPWDRSYENEVKTGSVFGGGIEYYFGNAFALGFSFHRDWFEHKNWDLPNLQGNHGPASLFTDWTWTSYLVSGKYLLKTDGYFSPYFRLSTGLYHLRLKHTLVSGNKIAHTKDYWGFSPGAGLQFAVGKGMFFLEADYNFISNQGVYHYPEIWFNHNQKEPVQFFRLSMGVGLRF